jgi:hypothetical protein
MICTLGGVPKATFTILSNPGAAVHKIDTRPQRDISRVHRRRVHTDPQLSRPSLWLRQLHELQSVRSTKLASATPYALTGSAP